MKCRALRIFALLATAGVAALLLCSYLIHNSRPQMPAEWGALRVGMPRDELLKTVKGDVSDMRELKGFESITQSTTMFGFPSYWQLLVTYDASNGLSSAEATFIHQTYGFMSTKPKMIL